ncbi:MAG: hypothetical protein R2762_02730 [Bryobacteraceae bacterium]
MIGGSLPAALAANWLAGTWDQKLGYSKPLSEEKRMVTPMDLPAGTSEEEILNICERHCRSDHFVLIDAYKPIPETFMLGAAMSAGEYLDRPVDRGL